MVAWDERRPGRQRLRRLRPALRRPVPGRARRRHRRQRRARAGRDGGRAALLAQRQRRRADLQRHADQHHRPRGRHLHDHRRRRRLRHGGQRRDRALHRLLRGLGVQPGHAAGDALGRLGRREHRSRHPGPAEALAAARGRQLHRRARREPFYRFIETLLHHGVTGGCGADARTARPAPTTREQMAVFVLVAKEGAGYVPPACAHADVHRRARDQPLLPLDRGAGPPRRGRRLRRRQLLPDGRGHARADGGLRAAHAGPGAQPAGLRAARSSTTCRRRSPFCRWIEELARRGVVTGCGGGNYCPTAAVTREQMGVFLSVTFGLTLYGP